MLKTEARPGERRLNESERIAEGDRLEGELAEVCGVVNAATARIVDLIAQAVATRA